MSFSMKENNCLDFSCCVFSMWFQPTVSRLTRSLLMVKHSNTSRRGWLVGPRDVIQKRLTSTLEFTDGVVQVSCPCDKQAGSYYFK